MLNLGKQGKFLWVPLRTMQDLQSGDSRGLVVPTQTQILTRMAPQPGNLALRTVQLLLGRGSVKEARKTLVKALWPVRMPDGTLETKYQYIPHQHVSKVQVGLALWHQTWGLSKNKEINQYQHLFCKVRPMDDFPRNDAIWYYNSFGTLPQRAVCPAPHLCYEKFYKRLMPPTYDTVAENDADIAEADKDG